MGSRQRNIEARSFKEPTSDHRVNRLLRMYGIMVECRAFEERVQRLFFEGLVRGTTHLGVGQEAIPAGVAVAMCKDDYTFCTYRGHNHTLARGVPMAPILAELFGRVGLMGGKGGSMHLTSVEHGVMGSFAIVGAHLPIALGAAWSAQYRESGQVAVCFFGDGATNIGAFHEALNLAAVWKLPVVFICENNLYMEYTSIHEVTAVPRPAADRAAAYGLEPILVDGNDVEAVYVAADRAISRARAGSGPSLIEALTYRHGGHSRADPGTYRPEDEVQAWLAKDPIPRLRDKLLSLGVDEGALDLLRGEAATKVDEAERVAREAPGPSEDAIEAHLWHDGGSAWRN